MFCARASARLRPAPHTQYSLGGAGPQSYRGPGKGAPAPQCWTAAKAGARTPAGCCRTVADVWTVWFEWFNERRPAPPKPKPQQQRAGVSPATRTTRTRVRTTTRHAEGRHPGGPSAPGLLVAARPSSVAKSKSQERPTSSAYAFVGVPLRGVADRCRPASLFDRVIQTIGGPTLFVGDATDRALVAGRHQTRT